MAVAALRSHKQMVLSSELVRGSVVGGEGEIGDAEVVAGEVLD